MEIKQRVIGRDLYIKLTNKALESYKKNIEIILRDYPDGIIPTGIKKNGKDVTDYYYNVYTWISEEEYKEWRKWALLMVRTDGGTEMDLDWWECLWGLREDYLPFRKKEGQLL